MVDSPHRRFPARMDSMQEIRKFVEEAGTGAGLAREDVLKLLLIIEELFTNTVMHGYGGDSNAPVWMSLEPVAAGLRLSYEDEAPAHDPLSSFTPMKTSIMLNEQPVGGLGVKLIRKLATDLSYRREGERNCISLTFTGAARG
ncbi:MAG TPA: ATP-binding protein [Burkholderiales bacterium]